MTSLLDARERIILALDNVQSLGLEALHRLANEVMGEMHAQACQAADPRTAAAFWYLKFVASITPGVRAAYQRRFSDAFDWLITGLSEDLAQVPLDGLHQGTPQLQRLAQFFTLETALVHAVAEDISEWGAAVLYTSRASGAFREWLPSWVPFLNSMLESPTSSFAAVNLAIEMAEWLLDYDSLSPAIEGVSRRLVAAVESMEPESEVITKATLALQGRVGRAAGVDRTPYAALLRTHHSAQIRFQVAAEDSLLGIPGAFERLLVEIVQLHDELKRFGIANRMQTLSIFFRVVHSHLARLVAEERHADAVRLLAAWRNGSLEEDLDWSVIIWIPHVAAGHAVLWSAGAGIRARTFPFETFLEVVNRFRGMNIAQRRSLSMTGFRTAPADRPDLVFGEGGVEYERMLRQMITDSDLAEALSTSRAITIIPSEPHPIQAMLSAMGAPCLPWSASLRSPRSDRPVRRVAVVASDPTAAGVELPWLQELAQKTAVQVECFGPDSFGTDCLRGLWEREDLDVLWVTGHGEFSGYRPTAAGIPLAEDASVSFLELASWQAPTGNRRLVVLNICYGAMVPFSEGLGEMGAATMLAGPSQAVVAHLWNSEWRLSAVFGCLLFAALLRGQGFFEAYRSALGLMRAGAAPMSMALHDLGLRDAAERMEKSGLPLDELQYWGVPAFFQ